MFETTAEQSITIVKNGPLIVRGNIPLSVQTIGVNEESEAVKWITSAQFPPEETYSLCRCGKSRNAPFCDGTHRSCGFDGTETADRSPIVELSKTYDGPDIVLTDAKCFCALARFCDPHGGVWNMVKLSDDPQIRAVFLQEVWDCPAGRLIAWDKRTGDAIEPQFEPSIVLIEDPDKGCSGPIWVRGGIPIVSSDGTTYEIRNRVTLCRCGASENKPFCDGRHLPTYFKAT